MIVEAVLYFSVLLSVLVLFLTLKEKKIQRKEKNIFFAYILGEIAWGLGYIINFRFYTGETYAYGDFPYFLSQILFFGAALIMFAILLFIRVYRNKKFKPSLSDAFFLFLFLSISVVIFSKDTLFSSLKIHPEKYIDFTREKFTPLFSFYVFFFYIATIVAAIRRIKNEKITLVKRQLLLLFCSYFVFISLSIFTNWISSAYLKKPELNGLGPSFFTLNLLTFLYITDRYRFLDIKLTISRTFKKIISFLFALVTAYLIYKAAKISGLELHYINPIILLLSIFAYLRVRSFLNSHLFNKIFKTTNVEYFHKTLKEFRGRNVVYHDLSELKRNITEVFVEKIKIQSFDIVLLSKSNKEKYSSLIKHFKKNHKILVSKEVQFLEEQGNKKILHKAELLSLGEICLPLYNASQKLIGFFVLGKKPFDDIYLKEEIESIEGLGHYLSLVLTGILYSQELRKEVKEKTKDIREMLDQQADFIAISAHELRTPLTLAILQTEELLKSPYYEESKLREEIDNIDYAIKKLHNLVQKFFDVQKYDLDKVDMNLENTNIVTFFKQVHKNFSLLMKERGFLFHLENKIKGKKEIKIDQVRIRQVFHNLLNNAMKFTPEGKEITLRLEETKGSVLVSVVDQGGGIPKKDKQHIFQKFRSNHKLDGKGIGLGLYICRKIVEKHRGKITIEDTPGGGASFVVRLPA